MLLQRTPTVDEWLADPRSIRILKRVCGRWSRPNTHLWEELYAECLYRLMGVLENWNPLSDRPLNYAVSAHLNWYCYKYIRANIPRYEMGFKAVNNKNRWLAAERHLPVTFDKLMIKHHRMFDDASLEEKEHRQAIYNKLMRLLDGMPEMPKWVFIMRHVYHATYQEMSEQCGYSTATLYSRYDVAFKWVRRNLNPSFRYCTFVGDIK